jgi:hypothetical protein
MRRPATSTLLTALAACACLVLPAGAGASPLDEYQQTGHITPCNYNAGQLQGSVPNDVAQYAPEFQSQLQAAARDRARGCGGASGGGGGSARSGAAAAAGVAGGGGGSGSGSGGNGGAPAPPKATPAKRIGPALSLPRSVSPAASGIGTTPGPVLALAVLAALALLAAAVAMVARLLGWGGGWAAPGRHALREAGMRIGSAATSVADWARTRRASGT